MQPFVDHTIHAIRLRWTNRRPTTRVSKSRTDVSRDEFLELVTRPYAQPTLARLIERLFGYSLSGSYLDTRISSLVGRPVAPRDVYDMLQTDSARKVSLQKAVQTLRN